jgi:hypothetical protein
MKNGKGTSKRGFILLVAVSLLLGLSMLLAGCESDASPTETEEPVAGEPTDEAPSEPTEPPDQSEMVADWETSPHAFNYDLGSGPNTYCSRCHSPQNWDPEARVDTPPNCVTCKFPTDDEVRMATTMDFVEEEDWVGINCETCHQVENGVALEGNAWLNVVTGEYEPVNTSSELCTKCHLTTAGVSATGGRGVTHEINLGGSAHANWAGEWPQSDRPQYCSDCHNPHSTEPQQCVDCHEAVTTSDTHMNGLNAIMLDKVSCQACHDASGMEVGPHPDEAENGVFVTLVSSMGRDGTMSTEYVKSHSIQWEVSCNRCHFEENPWELTVLDADGQPPTEE